MDKAVFDEFAAEAERQNKTIFAFASESLHSVAKISEEGGRSADLYHMWRTVALLKEMDVITLPSDFVDEMIAGQYALNKAALLRRFSDLGNRLVGILKIVATDLEELEALAKDFAAMLPIKEFKIKNDPDGSVEIAIVGAGRRIESTECSYEFLASVLNGYGYNVMKREINVGTIEIFAAKRGST